jgi:hypothetical protein
MEEFVNGIIQTFNVIILGITFAGIPLIIFLQDKK